MTSSWYSVARWVSSTTTAAAIDPGARRVAELGGQQGEQRPEPLAAGVDQVPATPRATNGSLAADGGSAADLDRGPARAIEVALEQSGRRDAELELLPGWRVSPGRR